MKTQTLFMAIILGAAPMAFAAQKTIDLGEMSVQGELRKPSITWIDSQRPVKETLPMMFKMEFDEFEAMLLEAEDVSN